MAVALDTGVPWIMCKQKDAPDPVVSSPDKFFDFFALKRPNIILYRKSCKNFLHPDACKFTIMIVKSVYMNQ